MSSSNLWAVVKKLKVDGEEGEYDAVPVSWIQQPGVLRYPLQRKGTIIRMATNGDRIDSDDEFEVLDIEMCKATYENFDDAYEACIRKAHGRRSKSSSENEEKGRGKRKRILKKFSDDDDDDASAGDEFSADESLPTKAEAKAMAAKAFVQTVMEKTRNLPPPKPPALGLNSSQGERAKNMGGLVPSKPKCTQHKNVPKTGQSKPLLPNKCSVLDEIQRAALIKHPVQPLRDDRDESPHFDSSFMAFNADGPSDLSTPRNKDHHEESTAPDLGPVSQNIVPSSSKNSSKKSKPSTVVDIRCKTGKKIKHFCPLRLKCSE
nr:PREDICTED: uncharacterized protein LOC109037283 isoform X2 [Bemisia tabaci]